jgi:hypothetical protein
MRRAQKEVDKKAQLSAAVMQYLGEYRRRKGQMPKDDSTNRADEDKNLFSWRRKESESDAPVAAKISTMVEPKLRVSNLLSKAAAEEDDKSLDATSEYNYPYKDPYRTPLRNTVHDWQRFWGSPIISSAAMGLIPGAIYWGINKYTSPDDPKENTEIQNIAYQIAKEDKEAGIPLRDARHYMQAAIERNAKRRWKIAAAIAAGSAALLHTQHINPSNWSELYKYPTIPGVRHNASMLGSGTGAMSVDQLKASVMFDNTMTPDMKASAMRVLDYDPMTQMTSSDIVRNAIYSGESAKMGLPMGRLITSAAVDGAIGYGLGKLFGAGSPKRVGLLTGIGSALYNALSYSSNN